MKSSYEVTVIGGHLAGLLSAALLAKRGLRVLLIRHDALPATYELDGYRLPRRPFGLFVAPKGHVRQTLTELALGAPRGPARDDDAASVQVAFPGHRFDVTEGWDRLRAEYEREFRSRAPTLLAAEEQLAALAEELEKLLDGPWLRDHVGFFGERAFRRALDRTAIERLSAHDPREELGRERVESLIMQLTHRSLTHADPEQASLAEVAHAHMTWRRGPHRQLRTLDQLETELAAVIVAHGGAILDDTRAERIIVRGRRARAVRLASQEEVGTESVVVATELGVAQRLLEDRRPFEALLETTGAPQARFYRYTVNLVVEAAALPAALREDVFFVRDPAKPLSGENALRVEAHTTFTDGRRLLTVEALAPRRGIEDVPGYIVGLRDRVVSSLGELLPFLGRHTALVDSPHDGRDPQRLASDKPAQPGDPWSRGPRGMAPVLRYPERRFLGLAAVPWRTEIPNLLLASTQVFPGLGDEGVFAAAHIVASEVTRLVGDSTRPRRAKWLGSTT